jgi:hypothetical protein
MGNGPQVVTFDPSDDSVLCATKLRGILRNNVQHWLDVHWQASDHAQDRARSRLLLRPLVALPC